MDQRARPTTVVSEFSGDAEMSEIVERFVAELPQRADDLASSWASGELEATGRLAHQLKGACAGYGFPSLGEAAAALEAGLGDPSPDLAEAKRRLDDLIDLCRRARA